MSDQKEEADAILRFIEELEKKNIRVYSRYGNHEETKQFLKERSK